MVMVMVTVIMMVVFGGNARLSKELCRGNA
jgi:hypothetical protein